MRSLPRKPCPKVPEKYTILAPSSFTSFHTDMTEEQRAMAEVMEQDAKFQGEKTVAQVKELGEKLTQLNNYVHTELLKLKELLEDKAFKKKVEKFIQPQIDELHERLDEEGKEDVITEIKERTNELRVIYDELREKILAALQVQVETNTKEIAFLKGELDNAKGESGKAQEDQLKALMDELSKLSKTVEGKAASEAVEETKKNITHASEEIEKLAAKLTELTNELSSVKTAAGAADAMKELLAKLNETQEELGKLKQTVDGKANAKDVDELKDQCVRKAQMKPLIDDVEKAKNDLAEMSAAIEALRADGGRTQAVKALESLFFKKIQELQEEFVRMKVEILKDASANTIKEAKKEFTQLSDFNQTKSDHEKAIDSLRDSLEQLKQAVSKKEGTQTAEAAISAISRLDQELEKAKTELAELRAAVEKSREESGSKAAEDELRNKLNELIGQINSVKESTNAKAENSALNDTNKTVGNLTRDIEALKSSLVGLEGRVDKVDAASVRIDAIKKAGDEFGDKLHGIKSEIDGIRDALDKKAEKQFVDEMKKEFAAKPEVDTIAKELEKLKQELLSLGSSVDSVKAVSGNPEAVRQAEEGFIKRITDLSAQLEQLREAVESKCSKEEANQKATKEEFASVTQTIENLRNELAALTKNVETVKIEVMERETAIKKEIVDVATSKTAELRKEIDSVKQAVQSKASKDELSQLQEKIARATEELRKLNTDTANQTKESLDKATKELNAKIDKLREELNKFYPLPDGKKLEERVKALEEGNIPIAERGITLDDDSKGDDGLKHLVEQLRKELDAMKQELAKKAEPVVRASGDGEAMKLLKTMDERMTKMENEIKEIRGLVKTSDGKPIDDSETKKLREELDELKKRLDKIPQDEEIITHSRLSTLLSPFTVVVILLLLGITVLSSLLQPEIKEIRRMKSSIVDMNGVITNVSGVIETVMDTLANLTSSEAPNPSP